MSVDDSGSKLILRVAPCKAVCPADYAFYRHNSDGGCAACSVPGKQRVAASCMLVHAVLTAVLEWANYEPVVMASVDCLRTMLHFLGTGKLCEVHQSAGKCWTRS